VRKKQQVKAFVSFFFFSSFFPFYYAAPTGEIPAIDPSM
jgi:hypothetical protein